MIEWFFVFFFGGLWTIDYIFANLDVLGENMRSELPLAELALIVVIGDVAFGCLDLSDVSALVLDLLDFIVVLDGFLELQVLFFPLG